MKTYLQFIFEVNFPKTGSDVEKERWNKVNARYQAMSDEDKEKRIIGSVGRDEQGQRRYGFKLKKSRQDQQERRGSVMRPISMQDLIDYGNRNLIPNTKKIAKRALNIERKRKRVQKADAQRQSQDSGEQYDVDHIMPQMNRKKYTDRYHKIHPGDASDNRRVISQRENLRKGSRDLGDKKITRSRAIYMAFLRGAEEQEKKKKGQIQA